MSPSFLTLLVKENAGTLVLSFSPIKRVPVLNRAASGFCARTCAVLHALPQVGYSWGLLNCVCLTKHECVVILAQLTDDDEALKDEEEEAQRLQREAAEQLQPEDFEQEEGDASSSSDEETDTMGAKARQVLYDSIPTTSKELMYL